MVRGVTVLYLQFFRKGLSPFFRKNICHHRFSAPDPTIWSANWSPMAGAQCRESSKVVSCRAGPYGPTHFICSIEQTSSSQCIPCISALAQTVEVRYNYGPQLNFKDDENLPMVEEFEKLDGLSQKREGPPSFSNPSTIGIFFSSESAIFNSLLFVGA